MAGAYIEALVGGAIASHGGRDRIGDVPDVDEIADGIPPVEGDAGGPGRARFHQLGQQEWNGERADLARADGIEDAQDDGGDEAAGRGFEYKGLLSDLGCAIRGCGGVRVSLVEQGFGRRVLAAVLGRAADVDPRGPGPRGEGLEQVLRGGGVEEEHVALGHATVATARVHDVRPRAARNSRSDGRGIQQIESAFARASLRADGGIAVLGAEALNDGAADEAGAAGDEDPGAGGIHVREPYLPARAMGAQWRRWARVFVPGDPERSPGAASRGGGFPLARRWGSIVPGHRIQ